MNNADWVKLLIPLAVNLLTSSFIAIYIKHIIDKGFKRQEKRSQYLVVVMSELNNHLLKLKNHIINLKSGLFEDAAADVSLLFIIGGDIQSYVENYGTYFAEIEKQAHKDVFAVSDLTNLIQQFKICGSAMERSKFQESAVFEFDHAISEIRKTCIKIIQYYNATLSNY